MNRFFYCVLLLSAAIAASVGQTVVTIVPAKDNTLYENSAGTLSDGKGDYLFAGKTSTGGLIRRAVVQFDVASIIPKGSTIVSVVPTLHMSKTIAGATAVSLYRLIADWGEGTPNSAGNEGGGEASTTGDATWIHSFYSTTLWKNPGGDYAVTVSSKFDVGGIGSYSWPSTAQLVADVQQWLDTPAANFGWIVIGDETANATAKRFESRENATAVNRPSLKITYTTSTGVEMQTKPATRFGIDQNYPNPFNPTTDISYEIPVAGVAHLVIYSLIGQELETLVRGYQSAGSHVIQWNAEQYPSGVYIYRLSMGNNVITRKMVLMR